MFPINGNELSNLIPQKPPFVLINSLKTINEKICITSFFVTTDHVLFSNGKLSLAGLLENMAQSSGCKLGYEDFMAGKKPRVGFIGEVRDFQYSRLPFAGEELTTEITVENKVFGSVTVVSGKIFSREEEIASCRMKIFFEPEPEAAN
jgi:predicted hotdog family 3-hydroxylacyl-ACP dehydratase